MRQGRRIAQPLAIFDVVMDRMIVQAHRLEGDEIRVADGARGQRVDLADGELVEAAQRHDAMFGRIKAHGLF